jgi:hypothetical protein
VTSGIKSERKFIPSYFERKDFPCKTRKEPADFSGMKTGNPVVFLAVPDSTTTASSSTAAATSEATSSTNHPSAANTTKDSLSLGLGFTAVQASY